MASADVIVGWPHRFISLPASAQLKIIIDRMFSLLQMGQRCGTMKTRSMGKTLVLLRALMKMSDWNVLEKPFALTAKVYRMKFQALLVPNAGESGRYKKKIPAFAKKPVSLGKKSALNFLRTLPVKEIPPLIF